MIVFRLTNGAYISDLAGTGAKLFGGRWNPVGFPALYTTEHISLGVLEILVHIKSFQSPLDYHLVSIEIPDSMKVVSIDHQKLKSNWKEDIAYGQSIGYDFLTGGQSAIIRLPSAIIDQENNFMINPQHPDAGKLKIVAAKKFLFDKRLLLKNE